jgi:CRISPR/Cas system Type II protein with McrA/HNH and RuvC-like nuclease domain
MDRVLVLNADYTPLNVTDTRRGFILVIKGKAEVLKQDTKKIVTTVGEFVRPLIIRLLNYVRFHSTPLRLNRKRIFKRDNQECVYCGSKKHLTLDHVTPRSRGGKNSWTNLVTCCSPCNIKKGSKTPEEAGMKLRHKPYEPTIFSSILSIEVEDIWTDFQKSFV